MADKSGWCVWVTGLPGSGKSVVSRALIRLLKQKQIQVQLLSSDELRKTITPKPAYSLEERDIVYSTLVYIAKLLTQNGVNVLIDATGNLQRYREDARAQIPCFIEAYLDCPVEVCMQREANRKKTYYAPKGIYSGALKAKASTVPGVGQPYESPLNAEVTIRNAELSPKVAAEKILEAILALKC
jgi:adenylylsulfate kinase